MYINIFKFAFTLKNKLSCAPILYSECLFTCVYAGEVAMEKLLCNVKYKHFTVKSFVTDDKKISLNVHKQQKQQ